MGLRYRTAIGTLREQRRKAEGQLPQVVSRATSLRFRNTDSLGERGTSVVEFEKRESLIERLRYVLASESTPNTASPSEYQVLQDELARISVHNQSHRAEDPRDLLDFNVPHNVFSQTAAPFRYVVIDGGKKSEEFLEPIKKLETAPHNFDGYLSSIHYFEETAPRALTLINSSEAALKTPVDPAADAAKFTQSNVTYSNHSKEKSLIPKSIALSLLDENSY